MEALSRNIGNGDSYHLLTKIWEKGWLDLKNAAENCQSDWAGWFQGNTKRYVGIFEIFFFSF